MVKGRSGIIVSIAPVSGPILSRPPGAAKPGRQRLAGRRAADQTSPDREAEPEAEAMIDHVSIAVRDLARATGFYEAVLAPLGLARLVTRERSVGFGKRYPELWMNLRESMAAIGADTGAHVCLRAPDEAAVRSEEPTSELQSLMRIS